MAEKSSAIGSVDTSMYANAVPDQPNMLTQLSGLISAKNALTQGDLAQNELAQRRLGLLHNELSALRTIPNPTMDNVNEIASRLVANGIPQEIVAPEVRRIQAAGGTPQAIHAAADRHISAALDAMGRYGAAYGTPSERNTGGEQRTVFVNPMRGTVTTAGGNAGVLQNTMAPGDANTIQPMVGADGRVVNRTKQQNVDIVTGRSALNNGFRGRGAQPGAPTAPGGGVEGPGPNFEAGLKALNEDKQNAAAKIQGTQPLLNALPLLSQLGTSAAGPGSQAFNKIKSSLITAGILPPNVSDAAVRQEAQKYLNQYVSKSGIAQRSDMGTLAAQSSSPNLETSLPATLELTRNAIASDRMEAARPLAYGNKAPDGYLDHKATFGQNQDLRAYQIDIMPPAQRQKLLDDMIAKKDTPEGKKFFNSLRAAHAGIYQPGSSSNAQ